ncbi:MAG: hypothetical protein ACRBCK_08105 [Alphaproteobacteria bacterium]
MEKSTDFPASLLDSLGYLDGNLDKILKGEKLYLDPEDKRDALMIEQIHAFYPDAFDETFRRNLDSKPEMYYITPDQKNHRIEGKTAEDWILSADTSVHPLHTNLSVSSARFKRGASLNQVNNFVMAGADPHFRNTMHYVQAFDRSENLFLHCDGDVVALSQTVKLMKESLEADAHSPRSIIIDDTTERFSPFLKMMSLYYEEGVDWANDALKEQGVDIRIGVVNEAKTGISKLNALGYNVDVELSPLPQLYNNLFFETSSEEKEHDIRGVVDHHKLDVSVHHANALTGHSEHAPEWTWTYGGNALDKIKLTLKDKLDNPNLDSELAAMGLDRSKAFIMVADGGESCADERLRDTISFKDVLSLSHPFAEFPGSETKPVAQRHGPKQDGYYIRKNGYDEIEGNVDTRIADNCIMIAAPLEQEDIDNPVYYAFKNKQIQEQIFKPKPDYHTHYTQRHFQCPDGIGKTLAELEEDQDPWMHEDLAISGAFILLAKTGGVQNKKVELQQQFNQHNRLPMATAWPVPEGMSLPKKLKEHDVRLMKLEETVNTFDDVRRFMRNNKGYVFPKVPVAENENFWMSRIALPSSIYVAKQLRDPHVNGNPMVTYSKIGQERPAVEKIFDHLKRSAMVSQDPHYMYNRAVKVKSAANYMKKMSSVHAPTSEMEVNPYKALAETGKKNVVLFLLSASSANPLDNNDAYSAAANIGMNYHRLDEGVVLKSGMGAQNPMGWSVMAGLQLIREGFDNVAVQGVQDPFAMKTEGWPVEEMHKYMGDGHAVVAPDIFVRIEQLLDTGFENSDDVELTIVCQANGIGGLQEISGVLGLRDAGLAVLQNANIIIQNRPREVVGGDLGPHDALIELMEERGDMWNVGVCETIPEMMQLMGEMTGRDFTYFSVDRPQDTLFPFAREKYDHYDWFMGKDGAAPNHLLQEVYDDRLARISYGDCEPDNEPEVI